MNIQAKKLKLYGIRDIDSIPYMRKLSIHERQAMTVVASVLPFRTNNYVIEELIQWDNIPADPIFQLTFPQKGMLKHEHFHQMEYVLKNRANVRDVEAVAHKIRLTLNPHPSGQLTDNVPFLEGTPVPGLQHKYEKTCLVFPSHGQTCHAYCTYCFRWPQFVGQKDLHFATDAPLSFLAYLNQHREVTDVLFTGGDPMVMSASTLACYIEPLLTSKFEHIQSIRIGTKSVAYWPYRYITDKDADDLLILFEKVIRAGKHLTIMAHYNHWIELSTVAAQTAVARIRNTGAVIRTQSPFIKYVNDDVNVWKRLWEDQVRLGCIPYYMFVARDTGANDYFAAPLYRVFTVFREAYQRVPGLARTVRGPSMSTYPGKIVIEGIAQINEEEVFVLTFLQARNPDWCKRPFFACLDRKAIWIDQLRPAFAERFFFDKDPSTPPRELLGDPVVDILPQRHTEAMLNA